MISSLQIITDKYNSSSHCTNTIELLKFVRILEISQRLFVCNNGTPSKHNVVAEKKEIRIDNVTRIAREVREINAQINDKVITEADPIFCTLLLHDEYNAVVNFWVLNSTMVPSLIYGRCNLKRGWDLLYLLCSSPLCTLTCAGQGQKRCAILSTPRHRMM